MIKLSKMILLNDNYYFVGANKLADFPIIVSQYSKEYETGYTTVTQNINGTNMQEYADAPKGLEIEHLLLYFYDTKNVVLHSRSQAELQTYDDEPGNRLRATVKSISHLKSYFFWTMPDKLKERINLPSLDAGEVKMQVYDISTTHGDYMSLIYWLQPSSQQSGCVWCRYSMDYKPIYGSHPSEELDSLPKDIAKDLEKMLTVAKHYGFQQISVSWNTND
jgi:hypothetical protein